MKKLVSSLIVMGISFSGCGSEDNNNESSRYDLNDYMVSNTTITKYWDDYSLDSEHNIDSTQINSSTTKEIITTNNIKKIEYIDSVSYYTTNDNEIVIKFDNTELHLKRFANIGETVMDGCVLNNYYASFRPMEGYNYSNVLEIKCDEESIYLSKYIGTIVETGISTSYQSGETIKGYYMDLANNI